MRLEGIEPPLAVPKTAVLSVERQTPFDKLRVNFNYYISGQTGTFIFEDFAVGVGETVGFISQLLEELETEVITH